jgi:hypothetical protein
MTQRIGGTAALGVVVTILLLLTLSNTVSGTGEVRFTQPYQGGGWRFWEGRKSARHPSDLFWARAGQELEVHRNARVERGTAALTVRGLLTSSPSQLVDQRIGESGSADLRVSVPASGLYSLRLTSDLGAFGGEVVVRWVLR